MTSAFYYLYGRVKEALIGVCLVLCLGFLPIGTDSVQAARTSMTGVYTDDTVSVVQSLKETISAPKNKGGLSEEETEAVGLITDYISRYRNRPQVNETISYTTMQTALNALAGHYKTFSSRPIPEELKQRLEKELSKAEELAQKGS